MGLHCAAYRNGSRIPFRFRRGGLRKSVEGRPSKSRIWRPSRASFRTKSIIGSIRARSRIAYRERTGAKIRTKLRVSLIRYIAYRYYLMYNRLYINELPVLNFLLFRKTREYRWREREKRNPIWPILSFEFLKKKDFVWIYIYIVLIKFDPRENRKTISRGASVCLSLEGEGGGTGRTDGVSLSS